MTWVVIGLGIFLAVLIYLVTRSLGKPVELPKPKAPRRPVAARQPREQRERRPQNRREAPQPTRFTAPDDDIEFLRSLDTKRPPSDV
jgi:hypothetical protein